MSAAETKVETTETKVVSTPEKKVVEEEKKVVEEVDDDSKSSENGAEPEVVKENGASVEKEAEEVEAELPKNGDAKEDAVEASSIKRKSVAADVTDAIKDGASPEKKAKLEEKAVEAESNGAEPAEATA